MEELQYFFSYSRKDSEFVRRLAEELREAGINLWLDQLILGGQRWDGAVEEALQTCQGMIAVLSPDAVASQNVMDEVSYALEEKKIVIPILLHSCTIPFRLRRVQYIDFTADYSTAFAQLLRALRIDQPLPPRAPAVPEETVVQDVTAPSQETPREVPTLKPLPRRAEPPEPASAVPEETLETGVAASIQSPHDQASHGDGKPFGPVPRREDAETPPVREKERPEVHRHTTSDPRVVTGLSRSQKRRLVLVGGVLLCGLVTALYLVLTEGTQLTNSIGMQFALIPAGEFQMGSTDLKANALPVHTVRISKPFYLGIHEVTQGQWEAVRKWEAENKSNPRMKSNPSHFNDDVNRPVEMVSWEDVQTFIDTLNTMEGGTKYRLPTEAEWEYAARAGSTTAYSFGDDSRQLGEYAWCGGNAGETPHPVGKLLPNDRRLYDMHGNVWERVQDGYENWSGKYTPETTVEDPQGPQGPSGRYFRGGGYNAPAEYCQSAFRHDHTDDIVFNKHPAIGFRLLRRPRTPVHFLLARFALKRVALRRLALERLAKPRSASWRMALERSTLANPANTLFTSVCT